tara:strand:+ start:219 stop:446 length:228 start_codon:yes stop_codon:yes gene_type:complete
LKQKAIYENQGVEFHIAEAEDAEGRKNTLKVLDVGNASAVGYRTGEDAPIIETTNLDGEVVSFMNDRSVPQDLHM